MYCSTRGDRTKAREQGSQYTAVRGWWSPSARTCYSTHGGRMGLGISTGMGAVSARGVRYKLWWSRCTAYHRFVPASRHPPKGS